MISTDHTGATCANCGDPVAAPTGAGSRAFCAEAHSTDLTDALGTKILRGDSVTIIAWGAPIRLGDTGRRAGVTGFTRAGNIILDDLDIASGRAVSPGCLAVARRDGAPGHEGNRPRCTCGARDFPSCLCGLSPRDFAAAHPGGTPSHGGNCR